MTVTDYGNGSIGAGTADLLANQRGSAGLQARSLYYHTEERKLRMAFTTGVDSGALTLAAGNVKLTFPHGTSGTRASLGTTSMSTGPMARHSRPGW